MATEIDFMSYATENVAAKPSQNAAKSDPIQKFKDSVRAQIEFIKVFKKDPTKEVDNRKVIWFNSGTGKTKIGRTALPVNSTGYIPFKNYDHLITIYEAVIKQIDDPKMAEIKAEIQKRANTPRVRKSK